MRTCAPNQASEWTFAWNRETKLRPLPGHGSAGAVGLPSRNRQAVCGADAILPTRHTEASHVGCNIASGVDDFAMALDDLDEFFGRGFDELRRYAQRQAYGSG